MLDIKLKSNRRKDILVVFCILLVFSLGFISCYPYFEKQAEKYEENPLEGENFLRLLFQNNLILYKNVRERATESKLDYADLYLSMEKRTDENILFSVQESESIEYLAEDDFSYRMEEEKNNLNSAVSDIKDSVYNPLNETMDFCAIDHETGAVYKNTGRTPEKLAEKLMTGQIRMSIILNLNMIKREIHIISWYMGRMLMSFSKKSRRQRKRKRIV